MESSTGIRGLSEEYESWNTIWTLRRSSRSDTPSRVCTASPSKISSPASGCTRCIRIWSRITSRIAGAVVSLLRSRFWSKEYGMEVYVAEIAGKMRRFFGWLSEKDRRRYAAVEAAKLGHGGVEYIARVLACDPKTIRQGLRELEEAEDAAAGRIRKKGEGARRK